MSDSTEDTPYDGGNGRGTIRFAESDRHDHYLARFASLNVNKEPIPLVRAGADGLLTLQNALSSMAQVKKQISDALPNVTSKTPQAAGTRGIHAADMYDYGIGCKRVHDKVVPQVKAKIAYVIEEGTRVHQQIEAVFKPTLRPEVSAEFRAMLRGMKNVQQRELALQQASDAGLVMAALSVPMEMSGLTPDVVTRVKAYHLKKHHPELVAKREAAVELALALEQSLDRFLGVAKTEMAYAETKGAIAISAARSLGL